MERCPDGMRNVPLGARDQCGGCGTWFTVTTNSTDGACNACAPTGFEPADGGDETLWNFHSDAAW